MIDVKKILLALSLITYATVSTVEIVYAFDERPISSNVLVSEDIVSLTEGSTKGVTITATITDADGCEDITLVNVKFYRTDLGLECSVDENNCYETTASIDDGTCLVGGDDFTSTWTGTIDLQYFADPTDFGVYASTDWSANVIPSDSVGDGTSEGNYNVEVETLTAISTSTNIDFGPMSLGEDTVSSDISTTIANTGNVEIGLKVNGYDSQEESGNSYVLMYCDSGAILMQYARYAIDSGASYDVKTMLTPEATIVSGLSIAKQMTTNLYWGLGIPSSGAGGSCSGTVIFTPYII